MISGLHLWYSDLQTIAKTGSKTRNLPGVSNVAFLLKDLLEQFPSAENLKQVDNLNFLHYMYDRLVPVYLYRDFNTLGLAHFLQSQHGSSYFIQTCGHVTDVNQITQLFQ